MLPSQKIIDALNEQVGMEMSASIKYDAIAAHFAPRTGGAVAPSVAVTLDQLWTVLRV